MEADAYQKRIQKLREENELLRQAAHAFGELAERLAGELRAVRANANQGAHVQGRSNQTSPAATAATAALEVTRQR